jgi:hypothetical protein
MELLTPAAFADPGDLEHDHNAVALVNEPLGLELQTIPGTEPSAIERHQRIAARITAPVGHTDYVQDHIWVVVLSHHLPVPALRGRVHGADHLHVLLGHRLLPEAQDP